MIPDIEELVVRSLESIDLGVVVYRPDGACAFANAWARNLEASTDGRLLVMAAVRELIEGAIVGEADEREVELFGPPRTSFMVKVTPLGSDGAFAVIEETTERRRLDQVRRDFVANISHELKTPVGAIGLLAETISDEPDPVVVRRLVHRMTTEAERVSRTIDDLLELSRIEFGEDLDIEPVLVSEIIDEACIRIAAAAEYRHIVFTVSGSADRPVRGDRRQLTSALYNLLDNAVKYSPFESTVEIRSLVDGDAVQLSVSDHGIGIPARDRSRVFERFYRVDKARSRETGGTGLGLAIVRHVVQNHGGEVMVESKEGVGSTFTLLLPVSSRPIPGRPG